MGDGISKERIDFMKVMQEQKVERKITKYKIIEKIHAPDLENIINRYLEKGWELQGGIHKHEFMYTSCASPSLITSYVQAIVKH